MIHTCFSARQVNVYALVLLRKQTKFLRTRIQHGEHQAASWRSLLASTYITNGQNNHISGFSPIFFVQQGAGERLRTRQIKKNVATFSKVRTTSQGQEASEAWKLKYEIKYGNEKKSCLSASSALLNFALTKGWLSLSHVRAGSWDLALQQALTELLGTTLCVQSCLGLILRLCMVMIASISGVLESLSQQYG